MNTIWIKILTLDTTIFGLKMMIKSGLELFILDFRDTVRPRDTRPQAARTLQVHVFE